MGSQNRSMRVTFINFMLSGLVLGLVTAAISLGRVDQDMGKPSLNGGSFFSIELILLYMAFLIFNSICIVAVKGYK